MADSDRLLAGQSFLWLTYLYVGDLDGLLSQYVVYGALKFLSPMTFLILPWSIAASQNAVLWRLHSWKAKKVLFQLSHLWLELRLQRSVSGVTGRTEVACLVFAILTLTDAFRCSMSFDWQPNWTEWPQGRWLHMELHGTVWMFEQAC